MPVVAYYLGRPAGIWIAAMSGSARATAANPTAAKSSASPACRPRDEGRHRKPVPPQPRPKAPAPEKRRQATGLPRTRQPYRFSQQADQPVARIPGPGCLYQVRDMRLRGNPRQR